jgi:CheY-like chemotaxis protein
LTLPGKPTILCVDDQSGNLRIRAMMLEQFGCIAVTATDHRSALKAAAEKTPDLAVIDYHLANGENGEQLAHDLRALCPRVPRIMLTGDFKLPPSAADSVDAVLIKGAGGPSALLELIQELLPGAPLLHVVPNEKAATPKAQGASDEGRDKAS